MPIAKNWKLIGQQIRQADLRSIGSEECRELRSFREEWPDVVLLGQVRPGVQELPELTEFSLAIRQAKSHFDEILHRPALARCLLERLQRVMMRHVQYLDLAVINCEKDE